MASIERVVKDTSTSSERRISRVETDPHGFLANVPVANSISRLAVAPRAPYDVRSHERKTKREKKSKKERRRETCWPAPRKHEDVHSHSFRALRAQTRRGEDEARHGEARRGERCA